MPSAASPFTVNCPVFPQLRLPVIWPSPAARTYSRVRVPRHAPPPSDPPTRRGGGRVSGDVSGRARGRVQRAARQDTRSGQLPDSGAVAGWPASLPGPAGRPCPWQPAGRATPRRGGPQRQPSAPPESPATWQSSRATAGAERERGICALSCST